MRRLERLLSETRISSNTQDQDSISDSLLVLYSNRVQSMIEDRIFISNSPNNIFMNSYDFDVVTGTQEYELPFDIYARNAIKSVNIIRDTTYGHLADKIPFISESEYGTKYGYSLKENNIVLSLQRNSEDQVRINYVRKIPTLGKRFGLVSAITSTTMTVPVSLATDPVLTDVDDFSTLVDVDGAIIARNLKISSHVYSTGVITYSGGIYTTTPSKTIQNITYSAISNLVINNPSIAYTNTATAGSEVVTVTGTAISVAIESGVSTDTQIISKLLASSASNALVTPSLYTNAIKTIQDIKYTITSLSPTTAYKIEYTDTAVYNVLTDVWDVVVTVSGSLISVAIKSGVTTALELYSAIGSSSAKTILTAEITGTSTSAQTTEAQTVIGTAQVTATAALLTTSAIGAYVIPGKYATSHSQLPDECEKLFLEILERRIAQRQSQSDTMSIIAPLTAQEEALIDAVFAKGGDDNVVPPIVDYVEFI